MNTILANQTTMLKNLRANTIDIKALLQDLSKSVSELAKSVSELVRKLDNQPPHPTTSLPADVVISTTPDLPLTSTAVVAPLSTAIVTAASETAVRNSKTASLPLFKPPTTLPTFDTDAPSLHQQSHPIITPFSPIKPSDSTHQILKHFSDSYIEFIFGTNRDNPMKQRICLDTYLGVVTFTVLGLRQALDPMLPKIQNYTDAQVLFVEMHKLKLEWADASIVFAEMSKWRYESKPLVFDPGGKMKLRYCLHQPPTLRTRSISRSW